MRKLLLTLIALLSLGVSGAWATDITVHYQKFTGGQGCPNGNFYQDGTLNTNQWSNKWVSKNAGNNTFVGVTIETASYILSGWNGMIQNGDVTIFAPVGYKLKSYSIQAKASQGDKYITPAGGSATALNTSSDTEINVSNINAASTYFTISGTESTESRVDFTDLAITLYNDDGSSYMIQFKSEKKFISNSFTSSAKNQAIVKIAATGDVDLDGYPTYKIQNSSNQYVTYSSASKSANGNSAAISWGNSDANNTYTITPASVTSDYVRIKPAKTDTEQDLTNTYWTAWNTNEGPNIVFWGATDNLSNWTLVPAKPITNIDDISNNKYYYIRNVDTLNDRGILNINTGGTYVTASSNGSANFTKKKFAFIEHDGAYYLYSVDEGKFVSNPGSLSGGSIATTLSTAPADAITLSLQTSGNYGNRWKLNWVENENNWFFNISSSELKVYNSSVSDAGTHFDILEGGDFDPTDAESRFATKSVTYVLMYGGNEIDRTTVTANYGPAEIPASLSTKAFVSYTYSPETIDAETSTVTITATWNGPFQISNNYASAKWYVVDIHSNENDYTWQYDESTKEIQTPVIAKNAYSSLTDANLWCFIGDPYNGFKIYNRSAGSSLAIRKENAGNTVSYMSEIDDHNTFKVYASRSLDGACCFKLDDDAYYLNKQNLKLQGWNNNDNGSSCRFFAPGTYHLAVMNTWILDAPVGAVGTKAEITSTSLRNQLASLRTDITNDPFCVVGQFNMLNTILNPINESDNIALSNGYYRIQNAYTNYTTPRDMYFNSTENTIRWSKDVETGISSIFRLEVSDGTFTMYSLNAQKYVSATTGTLANESANVTYTSLGSAQYNLKVGNTNPMHTNGHSNGAGTEGNIVAWSGGLNSCSAWYLIKVNNITIPLNVVDGKSYATMYLPFDVTLADGTDANTVTISGTRAQLNSCSSTVPAGTPVLLVNESGAANVVATITSGAAAFSGTNALSGTYIDRTTLENNEYVFGTSGGELGFWKLGEGHKLAANKAYLVYSGPTNVKGFSLAFDFADGIQQLDTDVQTANAAVYNLAGQRVQKAQKGIYIMNGKKVLVK